MSKILYLNSKIPFGKYKGFTIEELIEINRGYLHWLTKNTDWRYKSIKKPIPTKTKTLFSNSILPFGKHKGSVVNTIPKDYLEWIEDETDYTIDWDKQTNGLSLVHILTFGKYEGLMIAEIMKTDPAYIRKAITYKKIILDEQAIFTFTKNRDNVLKIANKLLPNYTKIASSNTEEFLDKIAELSNWQRIYKFGNPTTEDF